MDEDQTKSLTLRIPADVHRKLKILSAIQDKTMTEILIECVEERFRRQKEEGITY